MKNTSIRRISNVFLGMTIIGLMTSLPLFSQEKPLSKWGVETDMLAWRIGKFPKSFYLGAWYGRSHLKFEAAVGHLDLVENHTPDHFISDHTWIATVKCSYFFHQGFKHFWIGPSLVYENADLVSKENYSSTIEYWSLGFSTGYLFSIKDVVYFGPSLQVHFPLSKLDYVVEPGNTYTVPWSLEPGLRIGISL